MVSESLKEHAMERHLSFSFRPDTACWGCKTQHQNVEERDQHLQSCETAQPFTQVGDWVGLAEGWLIELASIWRCPVTSLVEVASRKGYQRLVEVTEKEATLMYLYEDQAVDYRARQGQEDRHGHWDVGQHKRFAGRSSLLHWEVALHLLYGIGPEAQKQMMAARKSQVGAPPAKPRGVDAHCHLARLFDETETNIGETSAEAAAQLDRNRRNELKSLSIIDSVDFHRDFRREVEGQLAGSRYAY